MPTNIIVLRLVPWWADSKLITQLVGEPEVWGWEISGIDMNDAGPLEALNFRYSPHYILNRSGIHQIGWPQELLCLWKFVTSRFQLDHKHCKKILSYYWYLGLSISHLTWIQAVQRSEEMNRNMEGVIKLHSTLEEICFGFPKKWRHPPTSPKSILLDPDLQMSFQICSFRRISFLGYEIYWNIPKITKLHLFLTWYSCTCPRNTFISVNENFGLGDSYYYLGSY